MREQEDGFFSGLTALVGDIDARLERVFLGGEVRGHDGILQCETPVGQSMPERKQRLVGYVNVLGREVIPGVVGPAGGPLAVEHGHLPNYTRPTDGGASAG